MANSHLEQSIVDLKDSLEGELATLERQVHEGFARINTRFDTQAARLERRAALWQTGRRWSARIDQWAERIDSAPEQKGRDIAELRERISKLEKDRE